MQCPKCNTEINDDARFCLECGWHIKDIQKNIDADKQICQNCGKEIDKIAKFCSYCGFKQSIKCETSEINWWLIICFAVIGCLLFIFLTYTPKKEDSTAERFTFAIGLTPEQAQNIVRSVIAKGVTSQEDLDRKLMLYEGGERLVRQLNYHDSNNITMNIDGENIDATLLADFLDFKPVETARIDVVSDRLISHGYGIYEITGVIKNNSNKICFDPFVNITTYDSSGNIVSQYSPVYISSLAPGESYRYNSPQRNISRYKIRSYGCR